MELKIKYIIMPLWLEAGLWGLLAGGALLIGAF